MLNWLIFCSFIFSLALTILGLVVDLSYQLRYQPQLEQFQQRQVAQLGEYLSLRKKINSHPLFAPQKPHLSNFQDRVGTYPQSPITQETRKKIFSLGPRWLEKSSHLQSPESIMKFFNQIHKFGYWNFLDGPPLIEPADFIVMSQLQLSHALYFDDLRVDQALSQTRQLALLLVSTTSLAYKRAGLSILDKEHELSEFMENRKSFRKIQWPLVPKHELALFNRFLRLSKNFLSHLTPASVLDQVFLGEQSSPHFCSIFRKQQLFLKWTESLLIPSFPFEPDFSDNLKTMAKIEKKAYRICPGFSPIQITEKAPATRIPYYRRIYAVRILLDPAAQEMEL